MDRGLSFMRFFLSLVSGETRILKLGGQLRGKGLDCVGPPWISNGRTLMGPANFTIYSDGASNF